MQLFFKKDIDKTLQLLYHIVANATERVANGGDRMSKKPIQGEVKQEGEHLIALMEALQEYQRIYLNGVVQGFAMAAKIAAVNPAEKAAT